MTNSQHILSDHENLIDHISAAAVIGVLAEWLPVFVAFLAAIWYMIRIGEWINDKYQAHKAKQDGKK